MSTLDRKMDLLRQRCHGKAGERLMGEMDYARRISLGRQGEYDALLSDALSAALAGAEELGAVTFPLVHQVEEMLMPMQPACKELTWLLVGHAHIDLNWLWSWEETVSITLSTVRSMLNLMAEHPRFTYAQSQAATYQMVEEYAPQMLEELRARVAEGRWEVTASAWSETDRNLLSLESEMRHMLYSRRYLSRLLNIPEASMDLDFVPDTFGHNAGAPDAFTAGGIKYMYHCRGELNETMYRWRGKTGRELLVMCDYAWYNVGVKAQMAQHAAAFCQHYGVPASLTVYGVGDHGGGPTNQDLYRMEDMMTWPIFPTMRYGTYHEFFSLMDQYRDHFPVKTGERSHIFQGCYTSQTRIKRGNALSERALYRAELFGALSHAMVDAPYSTERMERAWRGVMVTHFHDILAGTCIPEGRELAMAHYQHAQTDARMQKQDALSALCSRIDTTAFRQFDLCPNEAQPRPAFSVDGVQAGPITRREGLRLYHFFNPLPFDREEAAELTVYDLPYDPSEAEFLDEEGHVLESQLLSRAWLIAGNKYRVQVKAPACGYTTIGMRRREASPPAPFGRTTFDPRQEWPVETTLENEYVRAEFDRKNGRLLRLIDKETGRVCLHDGGFRLVMEDAKREMTSWREGQCMSSQDVQGECTIKQGPGGSLNQSLEVTMKVGAASVLRYTVSLEKGARRLRYSVSCDWREFGVEKQYVPQLRFGVKLEESTQAYRYALHGGVIERPAVRDGWDVPALHGMEAHGQALMSDCKYGFRGEGDDLSVNLVRSSVDPDKAPEIGEITCQVEVGPLQGQSLQQAIDAFVFPLEAVDMVYGLCHGGTLPAALSMMKVEGAHLSAAKKAEDGDHLVLHLVNDQPDAARAVLTFALDVTEALRADVQEHPIPGDCAVKGKCVEIDLPAYDHAVLMVKMDTLRA